MLKYVTYQNTKCKKKISVYREATESNELNENRKACCCLVNAASNPILPSLIHSGFDWRISNIALMQISVVRAHASQV